MSTCKGLSENVCGVKEDCSVVVRGKTTYCRTKPKKRGVPMVAPPVPMVAPPVPMVAPPPPMSPVSSVSPVSVSPVSSIVSSSQESEEEEEEDSDEEEEEVSESDVAESGIEESDVADSDIEDEDEDEDDAIEECATNEFSKKCNTFKLKKELKEQQNITDNPYLYPTLNDPNFNRDKKRIQ
jgi:hypothetical protein